MEDSVGETMTVRSDYQPTPTWARIPLGMTFCGDATSVAVDSDDNVYVFNRGPTPVMIFDHDGTFVTSWGEGEFDHPHGIFIDADDQLFLVDDSAHTVQKRSRDGALLMTLGERGVSTNPWSGRPFNRPTDVAVNPTTGDIFVSDGYLNAAIHKYDADGRHIMSWGSAGSLPGEFFLPHNVSMIDSERLVVADRENFRLQFFTTDGEFLEQWHAFRPAAVRASPTNQSELFVAQFPPPPGYFENPPIGCCVDIRDVNDGDLVARIGTGLLTSAADGFFAPHGLAIDSQGTLYVAEVSQSLHGRTEPPVLPSDGEAVSLRRWVRTVVT